MTKLAIARPKAGDQLSAVCIAELRQIRDAKVETTIVETTKGAFAKMPAVRESVHKRLIMRPERMMMIGESSLDRSADVGEKGTSRLQPVSFVVMTKALQKFK